MDRGLLSVRAMGKRVIWIAFMIGCVESPVAEQQQAATVCGVGATVKGVDVSYYQGSINWSAVAGDGVKYAFIRVSDGTGFQDPQFDTYWAGSHAAGIVHGAYQFFRPGQDAVAQADLLLSKIGGALATDDLPPVLDVEATDGLGASAVAAAVKTWVDHVTAALGRPPIIYTGYYFWRDSVGDADESTSPLWHAQYTSASCPTIADAWPDWTFWQYTSTGTVSGISGSVDVDRFNGDATALQALLGPPGPCGSIPAAGGMIDNGDRCYHAGGPSAGIRSVTDAGYGGGLDWTHTTALGYEQNFAQWDFNFDAAGMYTIDVYTAAAYAQSKTAKYTVKLAGGATQEVVIDQTASDGWQTLGTFSFDQGGKQYVHVGDDTGEPEANNVQIVFDAVRITPANEGTGSGSGSGSDSGSGSGSDSGPGGNVGGGCSTGGGGAGWLLALALVGVRRRRRESIES